MPIKPIAKNNLAVIILSGLILGGVSFLSPATFAMLGAMLFICAVLWKIKYPRQERQFLLKLFIWGWVIRMLICLAVFTVSAWQGGEGALFDDDKGWPMVGWKIYQSWQDKFDLAAFSAKAEIPVNDKEFFLWWISILFAVFRYYTPLLAKYLNILFSCFTAIITYDLCRRIFNSQTAKICSIFTMFMPSMVIWSVAALKEPAFVFLIIVWLWALINFFMTKKWYFAVLSFLTICAIYSIRSFFLPLVLITTAVAVILYWGVGLLKKAGFPFAALSLVLLLIAASSSGALGKIKAQCISSLEFLKETHRGYVHTGGNYYKLLDESYYAGPYVHLLNMPKKDILKWYLKGSTYLMLIPLPWQLRSRSLAMFMPQMLLWYFLFPFTFIGIINGLHYRWKQTSAIVFFVFLVISVYGLAEANIGTAVRHRDVLTPFIMLFAAVGIRKVLGYQFLLQEQTQSRVNPKRIL